MISDIHENVKVAQIVRQYPETVDVFNAHGLGALVSEEGMRVLAPFLNLGTALRSRMMNPEGFIGLLNDAVVKVPSTEAPGLDSYKSQQDLTLLGLMPCGLKMPFSRAFTEFMTRTAQAVHYAVEGNLNQELSYYAYVDTVQTADELPDIVVSADFNAFYGKRFYDRFVAPGHFTGYGNFDPGKNYTDAGIPDPSGEYSVICVNPLVIVANLDQVDGRPLPTTWRDVLDPVWKDSLVIRGGEGFFCHAVLLPVFQQFGRDGLKALAANVLSGLHPSQMVTGIDKNAPGALYVMPEFFAQRIRKKERVKIIWPGDGALASPVTLQVKPSRVDALKPVLDYLVGGELATILAHARFPVPHGTIEAEVQDRPLRWLGWEYLKENDLAELNRKIDAIFMPLAPGGGPS